MGNLESHSTPNRLRYIKVNSETTVGGSLFRYPVVRLRHEVQNQNMIVSVFIPKVIKYSGFLTYFLVFYGLLDNCYSCG